MNLQEFYRQAHYLREYTPTLASTMTLGTPSTNRVRFLILGRLVVCSVDEVFTVAGVAANEVTITTPTRVLNIAGGGVVGFAGNADTGIAGRAVYFDETKIGIRRYDDANWTAGGATGIINGWLFYQNGEPVV